MFRAEIINTIGDISSFEKIAMKQSIGTGEKINDMNSGEKINIIGGVIFHVENDKAESGEYDCCVLKTIDDSGEINYASTGSQSAINSIFDDGEVEELFTDMPVDMKAISFRIKKQSSKNNQGSFIILLPIEYI